MKTVNYVDRGADRYVVEQVDRFNQKNDMFKRPYWEPDWHHLQRGESRRKLLFNDKPGHRLQDEAFVHASWHLEDRYAEGVETGKHGLYAWESLNKPDFLELSSGLQCSSNNLQTVTSEIKRVATFFGADMVGICKLNKNWLYSATYDRHNDREMILDISDSFQYAISIAIEMDYDAIRYSPHRPASVATGLGYSKMAFVTGLLAEYIRSIGYQAIPCGNDTACSIPIAIDAGLGELARNGLLITPQFGPRVRLAKIFTDLPLVPDRPIEFGVWEFCKICKKCAKKCPSQAIEHGEPTLGTHNISNRKGVLRWPVNAEKCLSFWRKNNTDCSNCIRVCPFNKPRGKLHDMVKWGVNNMRWLNKLFLFGDDLSGYGKKSKVTRFWSG